MVFKHVADKMMPDSDKVTAGSTQVITPGRASPITAAKLSGIFLGILICSSVIKDDDEEDSKCCSSPADHLPVTNSEDLAESKEMLSGLWKTQIGEW
ncbi:hypothetical protein J437_LFUL003546 [Ladona fulva]|uniref:Uncharacterized protein n=1 Tax=Ladona fulva TaxID=123851 RepID=A0A8K0JUI4_LADFU|nr:hypothetical protein J437_LFUL003546 [Ladona fulva]